jgi:hypothetical protein
MSSGCGTFGEVFKATYKEIFTVAVKKLRMTPQSEFQKELELLV